MELTALPLSRVPQVLAEHAGLNAVFRNGQAVKSALAGGEYSLRGRVLCALKHELLVASDQVKMWVPARLTVRDV